jgi:hypothetical protein
MAQRRRVGQLPQEVIGDKRLPLRVVPDECLNMLVQEIGGDCHLVFLVNLQLDTSLPLV